MIAGPPFGLDRVTWALLDIPINGVTALLVTAPLLLRPWRPRLALLVLAAGILLDVDHAVAARSLRVQAMIDLPVRPFTHSLSFALLLAGMAGWIARRGPVAWAVFAALASHLLRDASGGGCPLLFPFAATTAIPQPLYVWGLPALFFASLGIRLWVEHHSKYAGSMRST